MRGIYVADISYIEKKHLERLFDMGSGCVLNFSNRTFEEFVFDSLGINIYDARYASGSGSKANRLRTLWTLEPNHIVGKLLKDLVEWAKETAREDAKVMLDPCAQTAKRLLDGAPVPDIAAVVPNSPEREFEALAKAVRAAIEKNEPASGLDRLHTFVTKYLRVVCSRYGIVVDREKPIHSLMGEYVKALKLRGTLESEMTERILKSSISTLEAFNSVRNTQSFAHDNQLLNHDESVLIFNQVTSVIRFITAVESRTQAEVTGEEPPPPDPDDPF